MKLVKAVVLSAAFVGANAPGPARADRFGWGLAFGALVAAPVIASTYYRPYYYAPYGYGPYYGYGPAYYAQPVYGYPHVYAPPPSVQVPAPAPVQQAYSWYFCPSANGYYPYVRACPGGWQQVSPIPPN